MSSAGSTSGSPYYANCAAARAAGVAPLHKGDPGYRSGLDRDGDGIACE
ncbi:MAG: excalibur calcium-binding domain-containing protein [Pseudonocardiaceae bacterium]